MANKNGFNIDFMKEMQELKQQFNSNTFLPLDKLIAYSSQKFKHPPRAQNGFVLFQKDLNTFISSLKTKIDFISCLAGEIWNNGVSPCELWEKIIIGEIKPFYKKLSEIAKKVHKCSFSDYKYSPNRKNKHLQKDKFINLQYDQPSLYYIYNPTTINFQSFIILKKVIVVITRNRVTLNLREGVDFADALRVKIIGLSSSMEWSAYIMDQEKYLQNLLNHFKTAFPLCNVLVTNKNHTIYGQYKHFRYEQPIFEGTCRTDINVIGRGYNTVFTLLGNGSWCNWTFEETHRELESLNNELTQLHSSYQSFYNSDSEDKEDIDSSCSKNENLSLIENKYSDFDDIFTSEQIDSFYSLKIICS
ncbi:25049_t:CDS:2 [Gigaspora margarita]|uniref:25049_t:CDS:1 n=1 Tax=Gigaspora margarita TaxID=4874 RepID=A0ABM8VXC6_GIGMA|nr:25049_t:CDS:2 [Gigaspora margarita]